MQPRYDSQRNDHIKALIVEAQRVNVSDLGSHTRRHASLVSVSLSKGDHLRHRVNCIDLEASSGQLDRGQTGPASNVKDSRSWREMQIIDPCQSRCAAVLVNDRVDIIALVDFRPGQRLRPKERIDLALCVGIRWLRAQIRLS
jgi:hypothetical protein